jgi:TIR domain
MEFKIFVSYSTKDLEHVELLKAQLLNTPLQLFIAEHSVAAGESLSGKIQNAIATCDLFVVIWSKNAKDSDWVSQELGQAIAGRKPVLPLVLDQEHAPAGFVSDLKYIPMYKNVSDALVEARQIALDAYQKKSALVQQQQKQKESDQLAMFGIGALLLWAATRK